MCLRIRAMTADSSNPIWASIFKSRAIFPSHLLNPRDAGNAQYRPTIEAGIP